MAQPRLLLFLLCPILASCAASSHARVEGPGLARSVLLIREWPDGRVTHSWQRAEDFDLSQYRSLRSTRAMAPRIVLAVGRARDCDAENQECVRKCMDRPLAPGFGHITSGGRKKGGKKVFCEGECWQAYRDCVELERLKPQEFTAVDTAVDWLKRNRRDVLVGGVIIIAGVTFVVVSAGAGLIVLAPTLLLAAPEPGHTGHLAGVSR